MALRTVTITAFQRLDLFRDTLAYLAQNNLEGWRIYVRIEPTALAADLVAAARTVLKGHDVNVAVNETRLGVNRNAYGAVDSAFADGSELNLCLEEDFALSPDATDLSLWYLRNHRPSWLVLSLMAGICGSAGLLSNRRFPDSLFEGRLFNGLGFAMRKDEWYRYVKPVWLPLPPRLEGYAGWRESWSWDWRVFGMLAATPGLCSVQPVLARANHTGRVGGTYATPEFHDQAFGKLPINRSKGIDYRLVPRDELTHEVASHIKQMEEQTAHLFTLEKLSREAQRSVPVILGGRLAAYSKTAARKILRALHLRP